MSLLSQDRKFWAIHTVFLSELLQREADGGVSSQPSWLKQGRLGLMEIGVFGTTRLKVDVRCQRFTGKIRLLEAALSFASYGSFFSDP